MKNALLPGLGGPMGRHARPRGIWFNPLPWAFLLATGLFLLLVVRHVPCIQTEPGQDVNMYASLCYSDLQTTFLGQGFGRGGSPLGAGAMAFSPLIAALVMVIRQVSVTVFGAPVHRNATVADEVEASVVFFGITAVVLFACFLVLVTCVAHFGRRRPGHTSWDALLVAASPIVLAAGLVNWDLVPLALTALGLVQLSRGRITESGIVLGLAACAGTMPIGVVLAVLVTVGLRGGWRRALSFAVAAVVTFFGVHLPLLLQDWRQVYGYYHAEVNGETGYGSIWYLLQLMFGLQLRATGSIMFAALVLLLSFFIAYLYVARKRPRVGSMIAVVIITTTLLGPAFPPQAGLWLLLAVVVARPFKPELIALTVTQVLYYMAIWAWLGGWLTSAQHGPYFLYWLAILLHVLVQAWLLIETVATIVDPRHDTLRTPLLPDPLGGVLNDDEYPPAPASRPLELPEDDPSLAGYERPTAAVG